MSLAVGTVLLLVPASTALAAGPPVGGCPPSKGQSWALRSLEELNIDPEIATGIPSLDGNEDGFTCIKLLRNDETSFIFRDNTVRP